jgi:hypothetical protein
MNGQLWSGGKASRMKWTGRVAMLLFGMAALFGVACGGYQASVPVAPGAPAAAVSFCGGTESGCAPSGSFAVSGTRSLNVVVEWKNVPAGTHSQKVSFVLPSGDEYQAFEQSFEVADGSSESATVTQSLPVAGTWIAQRRLSGMWQVNFFLDGTPMGTQAVQLTQ